MKTKLINDGPQKTFVLGHFSQQYARARVLLRKLTGSQ
jgi:hypothetical protein